MDGLILFLHGFCSSPASWKARLLGEAMAVRGLSAQFFCPSLSHEPDRVIHDLSQWIEAQAGAVTLVGSSLGGHYAACLAEKYGLSALLINPAAVDCLDVGKFVGVHANYHTGETFQFTEAHAAQLKAQVVSPARGSYRLWLETGDAVLDYRDAQGFWFGCPQEVFEGGDHSFTRFPEMLPQLLEFAGL